MPESQLHFVELVLVTLVAFVAILAALAQRLKVPYPILMVLGGLVLSFVPIFPNISLRPDFVFLVILPPLLFAAALQTSWREFKYNLVSISMLAFGLVAFTVAGVAVAAHLFFPGFDWRTGAVLGAVVCTTDAIAVGAIAKRIGMPQYLLDIVEGESLLNDATGLLALEFSVALVVSGTIPSIGHGVLQLLWMVVGGGLAGLFVGWVVRTMQRPLQGSALQTMISLATPYCAYLLGEGIHASGVLATVACGLYLGRQASTTYTSEARLDSHAVWNTIDFILNGLVFILIGLQLPAVLPGMRPLDWPRLLTAALSLSLLLIGLRMMWMLPGSRFSALIRRRVLGQNMVPLSARQAIVVGWSGLRGVLTLAAALSLPETTATGAPFPHRDMILFLAFSVILVTLVGQGLTLPWITRRLGVCAATNTGAEERDARRAMTLAALAEVEALRAAKPEPSFQRALELLDQSYKRRLELIQREDDQTKESTPSRSEMETFSGIATQVREAERKELSRLEASAEIGDMTLRKLERELDLMDVRSLHG
jgi:CPA1 family monovalent cation:H+ antiporter